MPAIDDEPFETDPVIEAYKAGIDRTLIRSASSGLPPNVSSIW